MNTTHTGREFRRRVAVARKMIQDAGGPTALARKLSHYLGATIDRKRIEQWRYRGVPDEWSVIIEHVTGTPREELNPHLYDVRVANRVIHRKLTSTNASHSTA